MYSPYLSDGSSNEKWARYLKSSDFRSLCRHGVDSPPLNKKSPCFLSWTPQGSIMVRHNNSEWRKEEIRNVFGALDSLFGKFYKAHTPSFTMYAPFDTKGGIIFHETTAKLVTYKDILRDRHDKNYEFVRKDLRCSSIDSGAMKNKICAASLIILFYCSIYL